MQVDEMLFRTGNYRARHLSPADLALIRSLNQQCSDFFMMQNGTPASEADAKEIFDAVLPGRRVEYEKALST
jgi:hypothetical protein